MAPPRTPFAPAVMPPALSALDAVLGLSTPAAKPGPSSSLLFKSDEVSPASFSVEKELEAIMAALRESENSDKKLGESSLHRPPRFNSDSDAVSAASCVSQSNGITVSEHPAEETSGEPVRHRRVKPELFYSVTVESPPIKRAKGGSISKRRRRTS